MFHERYKNFVRPQTSVTATNIPFLKGDEVKKFYLDEVGNLENVCSRHCMNNNKIKNSNKCTEDIDLSNHSLFLAVQNNNVDKLQQILNTSPDKINIKDDYGWTLLMIACQANSTECVIELLTRGIDTSIRDKAGNSARSLVIRNKNVTLATLLLSNKQVKLNNTQNQLEIDKQPVNEDFVCTICNKMFPDKKEHLSSTVHNLTASKGKKMPTNYIIPESNKGYQLMLKDGWDKESGLGPAGLGTKYPIKTVIKNDKKGLGNKIKTNKIVTKQNLCNKRTIVSEYEKNRKMEIDFRREFY